MASPRIIDPTTPAQQDALPLRHGIFRRVIASVIIAALGVPPLPLMAQGSPFEEPPLPTMVHWDPLPILPPDPFAWPPPSQPPLLAQLPGQAGDRGDFPTSIFPSQSVTRAGDFSSDEPWSPADLGILLPPDGVPLNGNPAGLALLENAVGNGIIVGEVSDATTLNPIAGAFVEIAGSGRTAETDAQGRFQFKGLPAGTFNIEASQLGYFSDTTVVTVIEASPSEVRFGLRVKPTDDSANEFTLEEETVVGEYQGDSAGDLFLDLKVERTLNTGLTAEDFAKAPVSDAGEAIEKVSGANIVDGKFAVVRGLADRYVSTTYNGASISSAVPSRKAVRLDLFPTSVLSGIDVDKIYSPVLFGDFGGAAINIRTRFFPEEPTVQFKLKQEYNPSLPSDMLLSADRDLEYFGGLGENIDLDRITGADGFLIAPPISPTATNGAQAAAALNASTILSGNRTLIPQSKETEQKQSFGATLGNTFKINDGLQLGILLSGGAGGEDSYNETDVLQANGTTLFEKEYQRMRDWNFYAAAGLKVGEYNEVRASYFRKNITEQNVVEARNISGGVYGNPDSIPQVRDVYGADANVLGGFYEIDPVEQDLEIFQVSGTHKMNDRGPSLNWSVTSSDALEDRPNYSLFRFTTLDFSESQAFQDIRDSADEGFFDQIAGVFPAAPSFGSLDDAGDFLLNNGFDQATVDLLLGQVRSQYPLVDESLGTIDTLALSAFTGESGPGNVTSRTVQSIRETTDEQNIRLDYPFYFDGDSEDDGFILTMGGSSLNKVRQSRASIFELIPEFLDPAGNRVIGLPASVINTMGEAFAADPSLLTAYFTGYQVGSPFYRDNTLGGILNLISNVNGTQEVKSHYFMGNLFFGDSFITGGVRFESERRSAEILPPRPLLPPELLFPAPVEEDVILPSASLGTSFLDGNLSILAAWSRTVARPTFYEFLPTRSIDLSTGQVRIGNPALENAEVTNYDLSGEYAVNEDTDIRLSFFKKQIIDPIIEERRDPNTIGYSNGDEGNIQGVEFEMELRELGPFSLTSNLTYIDAELVYTVLSQTGQIVTTSERFPFQPEWIFNANLGYEKEEWDFGANLVYNFTGEYATVLRRVSTDANVVQSALHSLDLQVRKGFDLEDDRRLEISAGIKNLFATDKEFRYDGGGATFDGHLNRRIAAQRTYFIEAKYSF
jgi:hypothetical protein